MNKLILFSLVLLVIVCIVSFADARSSGSIEKEELEISDRKRERQRKRLAKQERKRLRKQEKKEKRERLRAAKKRENGKRLSINDDVKREELEHEKSFESFEASKSNRKNSNFQLHVIKTSSEENHESVKHSRGRESEKGLKFEQDKDLDLEQFSKEEQFRSEESERKTAILHEKASENLLSAESESDREASREVLQRSLFGSRS